MILNLARLVRLVAVLLAVGLATGIALPGPARACTLCSCSVSTTGVSFGTYDPTSAAPGDASGTVAVNCTGVVSLFGSVEISASAGASGNAAQRSLRQGAEALNYNLYVDPARSVVFGNGAGGTQTITAPLNGLLLFNQNAPIYGRIPARQWARTGSYSDTIVITIVY